MHVQIYKMCARHEHNNNNAWQDTREKIKIYSEQLRRWIFDAGLGWPEHRGRVQFIYQLLLWRHETPYYRVITFDEQNADPQFS